MLKNFKSILFATNLESSCKPAFDFAVSLATKYQATIVLLHVLENAPGHVEANLASLLGEEEYAKIKKDHEEVARKELIAKKASDHMVRAALDQFCTNAGIDDAACGYHSHEIVLTDGDVIDDIVAQAEKHNCDMIVMGARPGLIRKTAISHVVKGVLHRAEIPVVVVPPEAK